MNWLCMLNGNVSNGKESKKVGFFLQNRGVVTIEALNDLTYQFQDISRRILEIEAKLEDLRIVLSEIISQF